MKNAIIILIYGLFSIPCIAQNEMDSSKQVILIESETINKKQDSIIIEKVVESKKYVALKNVEEEKIIKKHIEKKTVNGVTQYHCKLVLKGPNGDKDKMEWKGNDLVNMPDSMQAYFSDDFNEALEKEASTVSESSNKKVKIRIKKDGEEQVYEFEPDGNSDEIILPEEVQKQIDQDEIPVHILGIEGFTGVSEKKYKAQLGVMIDNHEKGVLITGVVPDSSADEGGLLSGDIITHFNEVAVKDAQILVSEVAKYFAGDSVIVNFIRFDRNMEKRFVLKKRVPRTWEEALEK